MPLELINTMLLIGINKSKTTQMNSKIKNWTSSKGAILSTWTMPLTPPPPLWTDMDNLETPPPPLLVHVVYE